MSFAPIRVLPVAAETMADPVRETIDVKDIVVLRTTLSTSSAAVGDW
jgi:hypothetical protein